MAEGRDRPTVDETEEELAGAAFIGLMKGDLGPLGTYLRSDYDLHPWLANVIADMIEGDTREYQLKLYKPGKRSGSNAVTRFLAWYRRQNVRRFVEEYEAEHDCGRDAAVKAAEEEFGLSRARVYDLLPKSRQKRK